jgi:hypothetical protein
MKHLRFPIILLSLFFFSGCSNQEAVPSSVPEAFLQSLQKNKFEMLESFYPSNELYKSLGEKQAARSDAEINDFLKQNRDKLKTNWNQIHESIKNGNIDVNKIKIEESLSYSPFKNDKIEAMVVVYNYGGRTWDDMNFLVSRFKGKMYLLEIPNATRFFSMTDTTLKASNDARAYAEYTKPEFKITLRQAVDNIIGYAKGDKQKEFAESFVYRGEDESRKWKSAMTMEDKDELQRIAGYQKQVNQFMQSCTSVVYGDLRAEKESEGLWLVQPVQCGGNTMYFAFLKVQGKLLLGDIDTNTAE